VHFARFRDDTVNWQKGEPPGSPFCFYLQAFQLVFLISFVMVMVTLARAIPVVVAIM
jgi:hypothetical protein